MSPIFGGKRDVSFFRNINRELLWDVITQQVAIYKLEIDKTPFNIYGEASQEKFYNEPLLLNCLIERGDQNIIETEFGPDLQWNHVFRFLDDDLKLVNILVEVGDILLYENNFYEINKIIRNQLFMGKNPAKAIEDNPYKEGVEDFGYNVSTICHTHYLPKDKVGINLTERIK